MSDYMVRKCKQLVREKGVLSSPDPKPGHSLPSETVQIITDFYQSGDISRTMPGKKGFVSCEARGCTRAYSEKVSLEQSEGGVSCF